MVSSDTQAILLLTAPLLNGRHAADGPATLAPRQYRELARFLHERDLTPSALIEPRSESLVGECQSALDVPPLQPLLARGFALGQAIERWGQRSIWVLSRADSGYPRPLRQRLGEAAPAVLYGCGDPRLLERRGFAIVGSRDASEEVLAVAQRAAERACEAGYAVVSGGARGVDQAAMRAAGEAGGRSIGVLADSLERAAVASEHRDGLAGGRLVLCSPYDPRAGFHAGHAMQRNKLIFAMADAALVVNSDFQKGGTWAGAVEQLERLRFVPVFVASGAIRSKGLEALERKGAHRWEEPRDAAAFEKIVQGVEPATEPTLFSDQPPKAGRTNGDAPTSKNGSGNGSGGGSGNGAVADASPKDALMSTVRRAVLGLDMPVTERSVAEALDVTKPQARQWLASMCEAGDLRQLKRPVRYTISTNGS